MSTPSLISVTSPAPRDAWHALAKTDPSTLTSQTPAWLDCICANGAYVDASRLYEFRGGKQILLPLVQKRWLPHRLNSAASMPTAWGIGGLLTSGTLQVQDLKTIFADLQQANYLDVHIRPNPLHGQLWAAAQMDQMVAVPRVAHVLSLEGGFDEVWSHRFKQAARAKVRRAERMDVTVECDTTGRLVPVFYQLFEKSLERWADNQNEPHWLARWRGHQRDSLDKFMSIANMLGDACRVWVAWHQGQPVASLIVLQGTNAHYTRGAMDVALAGPTNANYLLQKHAIEDACNHGCRSYHMGETGNSESLAFYKSRFGAVAHEYAEYHLERVPLTRIDGTLRKVVKQAIGFKDVAGSTSEGPAHSN